MCGISGRFNLDGRPVDRDECLAMRDIMVHRGPDDGGLFVEGPVGLGHRRLSIIDLAGGHQPLSNEDGSVTVVFNGEIYNFAEIREELEARGHVFATHSDTEVIVHLYEELGAECVQRFRGMFAFALWDARRRRLLLARDRLGIKPLYFATPGRSIVFGSEIKALLQAGDVPAEIDPVGLRRYLVYRHPYGHGTLFRGIEQLPPGHVLLADAHGWSVQRYWDAPQQGEAAGDADQFLPLLEESVRLRMISDVPLGAFLSGGVDSSVITALMARHTDRVRTFSVGFVPGEESELGWARMVAEHCRADHREFTLGSEDFFSLVRKLVWHHDEPMMFPASIPLYLLSRESKRVATVMLAGEGADEILAGYDNNIRGYWLARWAAAIPGPLRTAVARLPLPSRWRALAETLASSDTDRVLRAFRLGDSQAMLAASRIPLPPGSEDDGALLSEIGLEQRGGGFLDRLLYFQLKTYLVALLMKQDKMSMAASIETRVPFLDHKLVEFAFSLPDEQKIRGKEGKHLLKRSSRGLLPDQIIYRRKQGFPVPIADWFRAPGNPFIEVLLDRQTLSDGLLDGVYVRDVVERFQRGQGNTMQLWSILNLELWRREFLDTGSAGEFAVHG
ncbi:MAG: asparagine synthase (glutamine-hydrolyzing) [Methylotetracoccus sp.]